jgi:predicted Zn-dependent protease with MMP-like domain
VEDAAFERLVVEALDSLPEALLALIENAEVVVEEEPPPHVLEEFGDEPIYGLYEGVPLTERGDYAGVLPDKISIYKRPLIRDFNDPDEIVEEVRITVVHEIAHHFGIDDGRLEELGWA